MPTPTPIPEELHDLFDEPALGHVSYLNRKGQIAIDRVSPSRKWGSR